MAAVTSHIEMKYGESAPRSNLAGLGALAGTVANVPPLAASHANLTRLVWLRRRLENALVKRAYVLEAGSEGMLQLRVTPAFKQNEVPWAVLPFDGYSQFKLWGEANKKMGCPVWDLPAGGVATGGSCPGADVGQTTSPLNLRLGQLERRGSDFFLRAETPGKLPRSPVIEGLTICSQCYAMENNYVYASNQLREVVVFWWMRSLFMQHRDAELVEVLVDSMKRLRYPVTRHGILPVRIHSAGDFYSQEYALMWLEVMRRMYQLDPRIMFWAPTRTWATPGWNEFWDTHLPTVPNLSLRASGYNFGDAAPGKLHPSNAMGSTSLYAFDSNIEDSDPLSYLKSRVDARRVPLPGAQEPRTDFNCQVYADEKVAPSCTVARGPDGQPGCRACWIEKDLRINYTAH